MRAERILNQLSNEINSPVRENIVLNKHDVKLILEHLNYLESFTAALLRSERYDVENMEVPYRRKESVQG